MDEHSTAAAAPPAAPPLVAALLGLLAAHRGAFRRARPYERCVALVFASLFAFARHTVTQLLVALGATDADWSAWYRLFSVPRCDYGALTGRFVRETLPHLPADGPYVAVVDGVQLPRSSTRMPGTGWLKAPRTPRWRPGIHRAQRYLHLAALLPRTADGYSRALPLRWEPAFPPKAAPGRTPPRKEWQAALAALTWLRAARRGGARRAAAAGAGRRGLRHRRPVGGPAAQRRAAGALRQEPRALRAPRPAARGAARGTA